MFTLLVLQPISVAIDIMTLAKTAKTAVNRGHCTGCRILSMPNSRSANGGTNNAMDIYKLRHAISMA